IPGVAPVRLHKRGPRNKPRGLGRPRKAARDERVGMIRARRSTSSSPARPVPAGNSRYVLPSRYAADAPMSRATFNRVTDLVVEPAKKEGLPLEPFTVHDLRRTGSALPNEPGFHSDW